MKYDYPDVKNGVVFSMLDIMEFKELNSTFDAKNE